MMPDVVLELGFKAGGVTVMSTTTLSVTKLALGASIAGDMEGTHPWIAFSLSLLCIHKRVSLTFCAHPRE